MGRDQIGRIAAAVRVTHPDFRYQPLAGQELGNGGWVRWAGVGNCLRHGFLSGPNSRVAEKLGLHAVGAASVALIRAPAS